MAAHDKLLSTAEKKAAAAGELRAFSGFDLQHCKRVVTEILSSIGREGPFREYTVHDIRHINAMLDVVEWLIPVDTQQLMTPADWLLIVLSCYLHDLGMVVTKDEFERRNETDFPRFCRDVLSDAIADEGEYAAKIRALDTSEQEQFLYQEFVRRWHARRIRAWIDNSSSRNLGVAEPVAAEVRAMLDPLDETFREDLGIVCESHHLDDLDNFSKYRISRPYGNSDDETANVHYAALILRTLDLLHITRDRVPNVMFRLISPRDPKSQEWAKQRAVRSVRSKVGLDREGTPDPDAPRDTIEVHATFKDEAGFFGLTSYLSYTDGQLKLCNGWSEQAVRHHGSRHRFPWRYVDQTNVTAKGFLAEPFQFTFDQDRILDLLTGHTLYNDAEVVVRELVQNSLDAVRLQAVISGTNPRSEGRIEISYDSHNRRLEVLDNGTGMSQDVIENHLLKVGSSRYQDQAFQERYPTFSPISRFGIGVLSTFMLADAVEIVTIAPEDDVGRRLLLRDVHGRYLIHFVDKGTEPDAVRIGDHGTLVKLQLRKTATISDVADVARKWVVVPEALVYVSVDGAEPTRIGFDSLGKALEAFVDRHVRSRDTARLEHERIEVREVTIEETTVAFAVRWNRNFEEWYLLGHRATAGDAIVRDELGICVEGIRVEDGTPGYSGLQLLAIANATGRSAPKTNVARSGLEPGLESSPVFHHIYCAYLNHISDEVKRLVSSRKRSLTWAADEARYLLMDVQPRDSQAGAGRGDGTELRWPAAFMEQLRQQPLVLVEEDGIRRLVSLAELETYSAFWTVVSPFYRHASWMIREAPVELSYRRLGEAVAPGHLHVPDGVILSAETQDAWWAEPLRADWEPRRLIAREDLRQLDVEWARRDPDSVYWREFRGVDTSEFFEAARTVLGVSDLRDSQLVRHPFVEWYATSTRQRFEVFSPINNVHVGESDVEMTGLDAYEGLLISGRLYLFARSPMAKALCADAMTAEAGGESDALLDGRLAVQYLWAFVVGSGRGPVGSGHGPTVPFVEAIEVAARDEKASSAASWKALAELATRGVRLYDPSVWRRPGYE